MPSFDTPEPISVTIALGAGDIRIAASDRTDTVVDVRPGDDSQEADVRAAEQTEIEYRDGRLLVKTPKQRGLGRFGRPGSVVLTIELPAGSQLHADTGAAAIRCTGRLGECRLKTGAGDITMARAAGPADLSTGTGRIYVDGIDGSAVIKSSNGSCEIGEVTGELRVRSANGDITVGRVEASVTASTANGKIRVGDLARGTAALKTSFGEIEIGIRSGTAARLDASTSFGRVHNELEPTSGPGAASETAEISAHTGYGDIVIRRA